MHNLKRRLTSGSAPSWRGSQIAAETFPQGWVLNPATDIASAVRTLSYTVLFASMDFSVYSSRAIGTLVLLSTGESQPRDSRLRIERVRPRLGHSCCSARVSPSSGTRDSALSGLRTVCNCQSR